MNKKDIAVKIFNDLIDELFIDELIDHKDEIIQLIEDRLSSYLIVEGGNILKDDKGNIKI